MDTADRKEADRPSNETPPSTPGSTIFLGLVIKTGEGERTPISLAIVSALAAAIEVVKATKACSGVNKSKLYAKAISGGTIPFEITLEPPRVPSSLSSTPKAFLYTIANLVAKNELPTKINKINSQLQCPNTPDTKQIKNAKTEPPLSKTFE